MEHHQYFPYSIAKVNTLLRVIAETFEELCKVIIKFDKLTVLLINICLTED